MLKQLTDEPEMLANGHNQAKAQKKVYCIECIDHFSHLCYVELT